MEGIREKPQINVVEFNITDPNYDVKSLKEVVDSGAIAIVKATGKSFVVKKVKDKYLVAAFNVEIGYKGMERDNVFSFREKSRNKYGKQPFSFKLIIGSNGSIVFRGGGRKFLFSYNNETGEINEKRNVYGFSRAFVVDDLESVFKIPSIYSY